MKKVEQVDKDGNIFFDYDTSLSPSALFSVLKESFPSIHKVDGMICGEYNGKGYAIRAKNITYLGHPHPLYKKRIQIASDLQTFYKKALKVGRMPILLGVYTCGDNCVFCDFSIEDFVAKKAHNSSAHIYSSDLAAATTEGFFYKEDYFGNKITAFTRTSVTAFLEDKFRQDKDANDLLFDTLNLESDFLEPSTQLAIETIANTTMEFFKQTPKQWNGISCYKEMIAANYRNKFQPEWPGFYLEFIFERYLNANHLTNLICYAQDKSKGGIDLDLYFPTIKMYGDLKAHSKTSNGIQGNDWATVFGLLSSQKKNNHIFYIVCEHDTEKDSDHNHEVTYFWNNAQGKENLLSYSRRMKNQVSLTHAYIFDINRLNQHYLTKFRQGLNSNGKPREPKIMIEHDYFKYFILKECEL